MTRTLYGIKACDTMKKARVWLDQNGVAYDFHDYKAAGTTFRKLSDADKADIDAAKAVDLMLAQPSMIKRPVLDLGDGRTLVGFKPERYAEAFGV